MLFNSFEFALFLPLVFLFYWGVFNRSLRLQNFFIVFASYIFYGWWDWRFLSLIMFSSAADFVIGQYMGKTNEKRKRRLLLYASIFINIGFLGFFKYFNFFVDSFVDAFTFFGRSLDPVRVNIILPVGISFYTFQTLSYSLDIYRQKIKPTKDIIAFFAFVSFFPQLVAGPIERASKLLPQFFKNRRFNNKDAIDGIRQILWGLFKKMVIADRAAVIANDVFANYTDYSASTLVLGVILFGFQIYGDFSGYSDIAIGTARLFGFNLMQNFAFPYFSRDIAEFWRRWHISLSTWFRDYIYVPIGGNRGNRKKRIRNILIIFIISGFWHGANWTFVIWGVLNAAFFIPLMLFNINRKHLDTVAQGKLLPTLKDTGKIILTFSLVNFAWIFFRSESLGHAFLFIDKLSSPSLLKPLSIIPVKTLIAIGLLILVEWFQRTKKHGLDLEGIRIPGVLRWGIYYVLTFLVIWYGGRQQEFIYFQF